MLTPFKIALGVLAGIAVSVLFYEGIRLPWVGQIVPGIVWYRVDAATSNMVTKFERDTLKAQLDQERRDRTTAEAASAKAQERADATAQQLTTATAEIDRLAAEAAKDPDLSRPSEKDLEWLKRH